MNPVEASTAKSPSPVKTIWRESPNAYPVVQPRTCDWALTTGSQLPGEINEAQHTESNSRTGFTAEDDVYAAYQGYFLKGTESNFGVCRRYAPAGFGNLELLFSKTTVINLFVASGGNVTFNVSAASMPSFEEDLSNLCSITRAIKEGSPLQRSARFEALLDRALAAKGIPEDINTWARRLAENVVDLDD
jgi:hypothetical protein